MGDYIDRESIRNAVWHNCDMQDLYLPVHFLEIVDDSPAADVAPVKRGRNIGEDYAEQDQFVCSECGIELQDWVRVEQDEDDGEETFHEYVLRYCPNCGAKMGG